MSNNSLLDRIQSYENVSKIYLTRKIPVIIRIDGKAFHHFTSGFNRPFDKLFRTIMAETAKLLCENIQGCVFAYTQSDEVSLLVTDYAKIQTEAWFNYNIQKLTSISASMTTCYFNSLIRENMKSADNPDQMRFLETKLNKAIFDSRVFSIPKEDVINYFIYRQQDATRNSIESVGRIYFSHSELNRVTCNEIQDMLWKQHNINWNDFDISFKRGVCCYRYLDKWIIDYEPPIFTQNREYITKYI